ncbi:facilitated trehalose transporter Tret1-2 homolog [Nilaparvata lugens]|uniref:facilitated trehalose transporter Tret1-2 homolog n=1 Tax=Nilaparvata lugens TaxID=108931 RepID=UPI00193D096A|nr:facilitated trehalose transporter Tret1-2 homolog [Nilaparvata lugens]
MLDLLTLKGISKQIIVASVASLGYLTIGLIRGYSSSAVPSMSKHDPHLVPDDYIISWILQVVLSEKAEQLPITKCALNLNAQNRAHKSTIHSRQVYFKVSECAVPKIRGILGSLPALFMAFGVLVSYILGAFMPWNHLAIASALFPLAMLIFLIPLPESPIWLRNKNRPAKADEALQWLNQNPHSMKMDVFSVATSESKTPQQPKTVVALPVDKSKDTKNKTPHPYASSVLFSKPIMVPFGLSCMILIFQQVSGIDTVIFYTVMIFSASKSSIGDYTATIMVGLVQVVATFLSIFFIDRVGRRPLLLVSGVTMGFSMAALGTYFHLKDQNKAEGLGLLPVVSLIVFTAGFSIGYCNIPFLLMGELLPLAQRSLLSSIAGALNLGSMFLIIKTYNNIKERAGEQGVFWLYSFFCFLSCIFVFFFLPETKGKSLEEIENYFHKNTFDMTDEKRSDDVADEKKSAKQEDDRK